MRFGAILLCCGKIGLRDLDAGAMLDVALRCPMTFCWAGKSYMAGFALGPSWPGPRSSPHRPRGRWPCIALDPFSAKPSIQYVILDLQQSLAQHLNFDARASELFYTMCVEYWTGFFIMILPTQEPAPERGV